MPLKSAKLKLTGISATDKSIEIATTSRVEKFKILHLDKPQRIIVDIIGATSELAGRKLEINKFGITRARIGQNKGFLRIVLDSDRKALDKHRINASDNGVIVDFGVE